MDQIINSGAGSLPERWHDNGDGTFSRLGASSSINPDGSTATALPPGRAAPAASVPVAPDTVALAGINQTYTRSIAGGAGSGNAVLVSGVTTAGTVTLNLSGGGTAVINVPLGSSIWPFSTTAAALGTAVGGSFTTLFFA